MCCAQQREASRRWHLEYEVNDCPRAESCATLYVWQGLQKVVEDYLDSVTIQDILDRNAGNAGNDYCI